MPSNDLKINNRTAYFRKAITSPDFRSERVIVKDAFEFILLWLKRENPSAQFYWRQSQQFYKASLGLDKTAAPLTLYYCYLNAVKSLLTVKGIAFKEIHGVSGDFSSSKRSLANETIEIKNNGIMAELIKYLEEPEESKAHTIKDVLSNLPFIHRAFRLTYTSHPEQFIPLREVIYRRHPRLNKVWLSAKVEGRLSDKRSLDPTLPNTFERDDGFTGECIIRTKKRVSWCNKTGATEIEQQSALSKLSKLHKKLRHQIVHISSSPDLWYLKRNVSGATRIDRQPLTLICLAMHRLSELARYDPEGLSWYFDHKENWLISEFIELSPLQFIDEIACEMTGMEFGVPGIRPR
ncbi:YaaC family protein [Oceanicaulis sp.]|uniref:YaaC family protein n=1 Tax=Oceanicaulis sp. TaxID=1924941 RepID=UPI003F725637